MRTEMIRQHFSPACGDYYGDICPQTAVPTRAFETMTRVFK